MKFIIRFLRSIGIFSQCTAVQLSKSGKSYGNCVKNKYHFGCHKLHNGNVMNTTEGEITHQELPSWRTQ